MRQEALQIGLVADVVAEGGLPERALQAAGQIASLAPWGVRLTKQGMCDALEIASEQAAVSSTRIASRSSAPILRTRGA